MKPVTLTKNDIGVPSGKKVLKSQEYQQLLAASEIIDVARGRAEHIEKKAQEAFKKQKKAGYDEGYRESRIEQSEQMLKMVDRTISYLAKVEETMAEIVMSAVKKIIGGFDDKKLVTELIREALRHVRNEHQVTVRVPPSQFQHVKEQVDDILSGYKGIGFINPVSDNRLSKGSCIIESKIGVIDASIDIQLEALKRRFQKISEEAISAISKSAENNSL